MAKFRKENAQLRITVEAIIERTLLSAGVSVVVYDF
jgi:hypothetical protein